MRLLHVFRRGLLVSLTAFSLASNLAGAELQPGRSYFGEKKYIEYLPGDLPLVISAPHGGREVPEEIPQRENGVVRIDLNTQELARTIGEQVLTKTGRRAHLIICRLHRARLDCNREIIEAAAGNPTAEKAWDEYHEFIERALTAAVKQSGKAFYIDLHGQAHKDQRIELGYLHSRKTLTLSDDALDVPAIAATGSLRIAERSKIPYSSLLRGPHSFGALLEARGYPCTPSPQRPTPNLPYFDGGYSVRRHVAGDLPVAGLQIECNFEGVRDTAANRAKFATALVATLSEYLPQHFALRLPAR